MLIAIMILGEEVLKVLNKVYEPSTFIETKFKRYDMAFKTTPYVSKNHPENYQKKILAQLQHP